MKNPQVSDYVSKSTLPILPIIETLAPWDVVSNMEFIINSTLKNMDLTDYVVSNNQAVHKSVVVESSAQLKGSLINGPSCFLANGSLLRGGVILDENINVGHCRELKTSIMLVGSKIAHLNFVGDSIIGDGANIEGGAVIANYRNECSSKEITVHFNGIHISTGVEKFGAIVGSNAKLAANSTLAPGSLIASCSIIKRGESIDQIRV